MIVRMHRLPQVTLDTTLAELYAHGNNEKTQRAVVLCVINSEIALSSKLPPNVKFLYQEAIIAQLWKVLR